MKLYRFDRNLKIVECGDCELPEALQMLKECSSRGLKSYINGEDAISETSFGLYTSERDFIEVACNGLDSIDVHTDRLFVPSGLSGVFSLKKHIRISGNLSAISEVIRDYTRLNREQFEQKYEAHACR